MSTGTRLIAAERTRQIVAEGHHSQHDDLFVNGELAMAAVAYASPWCTHGDPNVDCLLVSRSEENVREAVDPYPWGDRPRSLDEDTPLRKLVIAGALIAAEIDRLLRAEPKAIDGGVEGASG